MILRKGGVFVKASFWDRVLMFLYVVIMLLFCLCMALRPFGVDLIGAVMRGVYNAAGGFVSRVCMLGLAAVCVLLSVYMLRMIFRRPGRSDRPLVNINSGEGGKVFVTMDALEQLARQAIARVCESRNMTVTITSEDDVIDVKAGLALEEGAHVPTVTLNMQRAIRNSIESNCGVAVRDVEITVTALTTDRQAVLQKGDRRARSRRERGKAAAGAQPALPADDAALPADDAALPADDATLPADDAAAEEIPVWSAWEDGGAQEPAAQQDCELEEAPAQGEIAQGGEETGGQAVQEDDPDARDEA